MPESNKVSRINHRILDIRQCQFRAQCQQSEYQQAFKKWPWQPPRRAIRPPGSHQKADEPHRMKTTNQASFVPHKPRPLVRAKPPKPEFSFPKSNIPTTSTYAGDYQDKTGPRPALCKPMEKPTSLELPFNAKTVYQETFVQWSENDITSHKVAVTIHQDNLGKGSREAMLGKTTVQDDFKRHENISPATSMKPEGNVHLSKEPFVDDTTYRSDFTRKPSSTRQAIKPRQENGLTVGHRFYAETTFKRDFPAHSGHKPVPSYKPTVNYTRNDVIFDDRTTQRTSFQAWPIPPKQLLPWAQKDKGTVLSYHDKAKLQLKTVYQDDFMNPGDKIPIGQCKGKPYRYYDSNLHNGAGGDQNPFGGITEYNEAFVAWPDCKRSASYKAVEVYRPPIIPFMAKSTSQRHYRGIYGPAAKSCKPGGRPQSSPATGRKKPSTEVQPGKRPCSCPVPKT